ncbi:MAG: hypothetical protein ACXADS_00755 [Candidatus Thorarchaeota archaeon]|jgi:hypothetical protein
MIRNLSILDSEGQSLVTSYFGECHSLGDNPTLISGFISALHRMGQDLSGKGVDEIHIGDLYFVVLTDRDMIFAIAADDEEVEGNKVKLAQIADIFLERYGSVLWSHEDTTVFKDFVPHLLDMGVVASSCGDYPDCEGCPKSVKTLPMEHVIERSTQI